MVVAIGGGTGRAPGHLAPFDFGILTLALPMGVAWKEWDQKSAVPPLIEGVPPATGRGDSETVGKRPKSQSL